MLHHRLLRSHTGFAVVVALGLLSAILVWRVTSLIPGGRLAGQEDGRSAEPVVENYLVFQTSRVISRGQAEWANDDVEEHVFYRLPLSRPGRPEILSRVSVSGDNAYGSPWMSHNGEYGLLYSRRQTQADDIVRIDVYGREVPPQGEDVYALPSPDGVLLARLSGSRNDRVVIKAVAGGDPEIYSTKDLTEAGYLSPEAWSRDGKQLYLRPIFEGEGFVSGLWKLDVEAGQIQEVPVFRKLGIKRFSLYPSLDLAVGATFRCDDMENCFVGPSSLYLIDLATGKASKLLDDRILAFGEPRLSPDGSKIAYTFSPDGGSGDIWVVNVNNPSQNSRVLSGRGLDWLPDGSGLIVERDGEYQIFSLSDRKIVTVARQRGQYNDPDFQSLNYIGIVKGKR